MNTVKESSFLIVGTGNIGKILVKRLIEVGIPASRIMINDSETNRMSALAEQYGVIQTSLNDGQVSTADVIILATPPKPIVDILKTMNNQLQRGQLIISMAAAVQIERMRSFVQKGISVVRILPNPPSMLGKGINPVAFESGESVEVKEFTFSLLKILGYTLEVDDEIMAWCVGLSGAALRTILPVLEGMTQAGLEAGLSQSEARRIAALNLAGVAALALETDLPLDEIRTLTPMQTLDEKATADLFLETARNTRQKVETTQAMLLESK